MNNGKIKFQGIIFAVVTPFAHNGDIDKKLFVDNIQRVMEEGAGARVNFEKMCLHRWTCHHPHAGRTCPANE